MEVFVARQPILNKYQEVVAYEILYRRNMNNEFPNMDGDQATSDVINSFIQMGFDDISDGKPCFINFTETFLKLDIPAYFHPSMLVIEVLETVKFTDEVINLCGKLKSQGFKIVLDDFPPPDLNNVQIKRMLDIADMVKVDIRAVTEKQRMEIPKILKRFDVELLAEKVETREEFVQCLKAGYQFFQGYFFSKPDILSTQDIPVLSQLFYSITNELASPEPNVNKIVETIEHDLAFSYKLLKFINTPAFDLIYEIKSIRQAILILGLKEFRKWIYVLSIREAISDKSNVCDEIFKLCLVRAKVCESIAIKLGHIAESSSYFLMGLFSLVHILLKQPLRKVMEDLPLDMDIKYALLGFSSPYKEALDLAIAMEQVHWERISTLTDKMHLLKGDLCSLYMDAVGWVNEVYLEPSTN